MTIGEREAYMGDGLYASIDVRAEMLILRAPREFIDHWVGLEPPVFDQFLEYACKMGYADALERALRRHRE
jgi:hypothetical protein